MVYRGRTFIHVKLKHLYMRVTWRCLSVSACRTLSRSDFSFNKVIHNTWAFCSKLSTPLSLHSFTPQGWGCNDKLAFNISLLISYNNTTEGAILERWPCYWTYIRSGPETPGFVDGVLSSPICHAEVRTPTLIWSGQIVVDISCSRKLYFS